MSEENLDAMLRFIDAFNRRDLPALLSCCDSDIELDWSRVLIGTPTYRGHRGIEQLFRDMTAAWEELQIDSHDAVAVGGDALVSVGEGSGKGKTTGAPFATHGATHVKFTHGKISRIEAFPNKQDALKAAGLEE